MPHTLAAASSFVRQGLSFSELSISSFFLLDPYSDYVGVNILLNNSSSLSLLNVYASFDCLRRIAKPTPFPSPFISPPQMSSFSRTSTAFIPSDTQKLLPIPVGKKNLIGSSLLTSFRSMTLTYLLFSIAPLTVAPLMTYLLIPFCFALSCSWAVLQDLVSNHLPILLTVPVSSVFRPNKRPFPSIFRNLVGVTFLYNSILTVLLQRNTRFFLFPLLLLSVLLWH